jgi:hypothetical protein
MAPAGPRQDTRWPDVARGAPGAQTPITSVRSDRAVRQRETTMDSSQQRHPTLALLQAMLPAETDSASDGQLHPSAW